MHSIAPWKRRAIDWYKRDYKLLSELFLGVQQRIVSHTHFHAFGYPSIPFRLKAMSARVWRLL